MITRKVIVVLHFFHGCKGHDVCQVHLCHIVTSRSIKLDTIQHIKSSDITYQR